MKSFTSAAPITFPTTRIIGGIEHTFFTKETPDFNYDNIAELGSEMHWEAIISHPLPNGNTYYARVGYCDSEAHAESILIIHL